MYCGDSCRVMAHKARRNPESQLVKIGETKNELDFSAHNVGTTAVGAGVAVLGNYLLNDQPAHQRLLTRIAQVDQKAQRRFNKLDQGMQFIIDGINALKAQNPTMRAAFDHIQADRLLKEATPPQDLRSSLEEWSKLYNDK